MLTVFAEPTQSAAMGAQGAGANGLITMGVYLVAMIAIFYFILIRPQKKRENETKMMLGSLKVGDKIVSIGGIYGKITQIKDDTIIIESGAINDKCSIKLSRSAVKEVISKDTSNGKKEENNEK